MVLTPSCLMVVMIGLLVTYTTGYVSHHFLRQNDTNQYGHGLGSGLS